MHPEYPPTIVLRHRRENLKKCSLTGLEKRADFLFFPYPGAQLPILKDYLLLKQGAPLLTIADQDRGLFLIDGTWKLATLMESQIPPMEARSLPPHFRTAYPRKQTECPDPETGLSSLEALFIAYAILQRPVEGLLDRYYWKEAFLERNSLC